MILFLGSDNDDNEDNVTTKINFYCRHTVHKKIKTSLEYISSIIILLNITK